MGCRGWTHASRVLFSAGTRSEFELLETSSLMRQGDSAFASISGMSGLFFQSANTRLVFCLAFSRGRRAKARSTHHELSWERTANGTF